MKLLCIQLCLLLFGIVAITAIPSGRKSELLGAKECTWGPSYWCKNITTAKSCGAVKHCIQSVWEHQTMPTDNDDVCKICKDMVSQARAQLESNETQDELRQVFEGSCKLIPLKIVTKECVTLVDEFIPELVETLASQMNPQVVCAVAGLCNNARIDYMLLNGEDADAEKDTSDTELLEDDCKGCNYIAKHMELKFRSTPRDKILNNLLESCGRLGSLSDGCSAIVITHFNSLYNHLSKNLASDGLCHLAGVCQHKFHVHNQKNIEVTHESSVGYLKPKKETDDLPCELCEQLVLHLRDILVANTTEAEFEEVLTAICKQFKGFKDQCLSIVNEYYAGIYDFLVNSLKPNDVCQLVGICPQPGRVEGPIWPLIPTETANIFELRKGYVVGQDEANSYGKGLPVIGQDEANSYGKDIHISGQDEANIYNTLHRVALSGKGIRVQVRKDENQNQFVLPQERYMPQTMTYVANKEACTLCEYLLHYLQVALTTPATESEIKHVVDQACNHLPETISAQCQAFVSTYGDALVALLAQEIDPSQVCPQLGLCPQSTVMLDLTHSVGDKPTCPLCLFAVEELVTKLKNNKTEEDIKQALDNLCSDLPKSLSPDCRNFVETYSEELVDMLIADFTPQEICAYLKLCDAPTVPHDILTNDIPQWSDERVLPQTIIDEETIKAKTAAKDSNSCVICEFVMTKIDSALKDRRTEAEIKQVVHDVCNYMPKTVMKECNGFVDQYADLVITLLAQSLDPKEVCTEINLCRAKTQTRLEIAASLEECAVCDAALGALDELLADPSIERDISRAMQKVCALLPKHNLDQCKSMIKIYGPSILNLIAAHTPPQVICGEIGMCTKHRQVVNLLGGKKCTWGPGYWCQSEQHAKGCGALAHCQENVWMADKPKTAI